MEQPFETAASPFLSLYFKATALCPILLEVVQTMALSPACPWDKAAGPPLGHRRSCVINLGAGQEPCGLVLTLGHTVTSADSRA